MPAGTSPAAEHEENIMSIDISDPLVHPFYKQAINDLASNFGTIVRNDRVVKLRMARLLENHYGIRSEAAMVSYLGSPAAAEERKRIEATSHGITSERRNTDVASAYPYYDLSKLSDEPRLHTIPAQAPHIEIELGADTIEISMALPANVDPEAKDPYANSGWVEQVAISATGVEVRPLADLLCRAARELMRMLP